ncbi:uncharacterized protein K452DRAFT_288342 [Aplosporella prunicola CBS 121167]|uniref:DUF952 domain-containing protein n=1 Tax=Aplosporella prunicola CBS 121167 TaxID=1176127 RepID=A0A6A6B9S0_9PEZI|nr:uncharacterized protein K452DRAFT_288342 [Aplosporella prunicola CBS 121167]KAF2140949.1 hypothetical protein K452DRAFT_288342 [Aplosporella prunicola CBS 121167]
MAADTAHPTIAYKILTALQYADWVDKGIFIGASIDLQDGYIHLSTATQSLETYARYFAAQPDLVVAELDLSRLGEGAELKWEESRGGDLFPHIYGKGIPIAAVKRHWDRVDRALMEGLAEGTV